MLSPYNFESATIDPHFGLHTHIAVSHMSLGASGNVIDEYITDGYIDLPDAFFEDALWEDKKIMRLLWRMGNNMAGHYHQR